MGSPADADADAGALVVQVLTAAPLPPAESDFFDLLKLFFPAVYDIKYLMKFCDNLHGEPRPAPTSPLEIPGHAPEGRGGGWFPSKWAFSLKRGPPCACVWLQGG